MDRRVLLVRVVNVYGRETVYPANRAAELIAQIAGHKTLTPATLRLAEQLGYEVHDLSRRVPLASAN
jgi:hypothetical protein